MGKFVKLVLSVAFSMVIGILPAYAELPGIKVAEANLITPSNALSYYDNAIDTCPPGSCYRVLETPLEVIELAKALGANRVPDSEFTKNVYEYVYQNISVTPLFGLQEGALGAILDQSGTAFDQAQLMVGLLKQDTTVSASVSYKFGTITLPELEVAKWFGVAYKNNGNIIFNSVALQKVMANGGIPALFLGGNVTLSHIWVEAMGNEYDPSYKKHKFYEGIDLASAMGCGTDTNSICGDNALTEAIPSNYLSTNNVQNVNNTGLNAKLKLYGESLIGYLDANHSNASVEEIIGGYVIDHNQFPDKAHTATRMASSNWMTIPNQYRTTFSVKFDNTYGKFFADEVVGKRVRFFGEMGPRSGNVASRKTTLYVEYDIVDSSVRSGGSVDNDDVILVVDHPYAAKADSLSANPIALDGTYMNRTLVQKTFAQYEYIDNDPGTTDPYYFHAITIIHGFGGAGPAALIKMQNIQIANNYVLDVPVPSDPDHLYNKCQEKSGLRGYVTSPNVVTEINFGCLDLLTPSVVTRWLVQVEKYRQLVSKINNSSIQIHYSLGNSTLSTMNIESGISIEGNTNAPADRITASHSFASGYSRLEGGMLEQLAGEWEGDSAVGLFLRSNDKGHNFLKIDSSNKTSLLPTLTDYSQERKSLIESYINDGHVVILPQDGDIGTFTLTTLASRSINTASFFAYKAADHSSLAYIVDNGFKGAGAGEEDLYNKVLGNLLSIDNKNNVLKPYSSINQANGELTIKMPPDITTGAGRFPYSLPFIRTYSSQESFLPIRLEPALFGGRLASGVGSILRGGWKHNYEITANITSDALQAMGADSAKDAWSTIVALVTLRDLNAQSHTIQNILTSIFVTDWWGRGLQDNAILINGAGASGVYIKLPDGNSYNPPINSANKLIQINLRLGPLPGGNRTVFYYGDITLSLTNRYGEVMQFSIGGTGVNPISGMYNGRKNFIIDNWSFPSGIVLNFENETRTVSAAGYGATTPIEDIFLLKKITNNLGRSLNFGLTDVNNESSRIGYVEDDQLRRVSYPVGATGKGVNNGTRSILSTRGIGTLSGEYNSPSFRVKRLDNTEEIYNYTSTTHSPYVQNSTAQITELYLPGNTNTPFLTASYDGLDRIKTVADASGNINNYYIGSISRNKFARGEAVNSLGNQFVSYFNDNGSIIKYLDPLGRVTTNDYDGIGRLIKTIFPEENGKEYSYDVRHNQIQVKQIAKSGSGSADIIISTTYMEGASVLSCSNMKTCNKPLSVTDANGNVTSYTYSASTGNTLTETKPSVTGGSPVTAFAYNVYGQVTSVTDPLNMVSTFAYDTLANHSVLKTAVTDSGGQGLATTFTYDNVGNVLAINGPRTDVTDISTFEYDTLRRVTKAINSDGSFGKNIFDLDGQLIRTEKYTSGGTVPLQVTEIDYTLTGQVDKAYDPECFDGAGVRNIALSGCSITTTSYDVLDRPDIVTDGEGRQTQTIYLADGKVNKIIKALGTAIQQDYATYTYTTNGQQASVKDANGNLTEYFYDGFDRLDKFQLPHPSNTGQSNPADYEQYTYDNNGNMTVKRKRDGKTITSVYDALNRVITKFPQGQPSVSYTYDKVGRQTDVDFVGGGHLIHHTYDTAGRLITTNDNGRTLSYQYTDKVNRTRIIWPDGYSADYAYDNLNRVTTIKENNAGVLATYAYDTSGRRVSITLGNGTVTSYSYHNDDALNTLSHNVNGTADDVDWTYGFNKVNQLTNKIMGGGANLSLYKWEPQYAKTDAYTSNGLNQYANVAGTNLSYDLNGNLTSDGVWNYVYDTENMLLNASKAGASASYIYDPLGRRSAKTVDTVLTAFLNDGVEEIADYNSSGALLRRYVHGPGIDEYLVMYTGTSTANKSYFHANHQGSIIAMSDGSGNVTEQHSYDSYGNSDDLTGNPFRYTGRRLDAETGLYYYRARYYSPSIGRFLQTDPIGYGDGLNWYAYVGNDSLNRTDPSGNCPSCIGFVIGGLLDAGLQLAEIALDDDKSLSDFKKADVLISALGGAIGVGVISKISKISKIGTLAKTALSTTVDASVSATGQAIKTGKVSAVAVAGDLLGGKLVGTIAGKLTKSVTNKLSNAVKKAGRIANDPKRTTNQRRNARERASIATTKRNNIAAATGTVAGGLGGKGAEEGIKDLCKIDKVKC